jgi:hypothetical protein
MATFVIIVLVVLVIVLLARLDQTPGPYSSRPCAGRAWRHAFPNADKKQIRDFLQAFVEAFMFPTANRLHFLPSDVVMDVYKKVKGLWWDSMELEFFIMNLKDEFNVDIESRWHEQITLGEIFSHVVAGTSGTRAT